MQVDEAEVAAAAEQAVRPRREDVGLVRVRVRVRVRVKVEW